MRIFPLSLFALFIAVFPFVLSQPKPPTDVRQKPACWRRRRHLGQPQRPYLQDLAIKVIDALRHGVKNAQQYCVIWRIGGPKLVVDAGQLRRPLPV